MQNSPSILLPTLVVSIVLMACSQPSPKTQKSSESRNPTTTKQQEQTTETDQNAAIPYVARPEADDATAQPLATPTPPELGSKHDPDKIATQTTASDGIERNVLKHVAKTGWSVFAILGDDEGPGFAFTVGLYKSYGHPEIFVSGFPQETSIQFLNLAGKAVKEGEVFDVGEQTDLLAQEVAMRFAEFPNGLVPEHLGTAKWYYKHNSFPVIQLIWPDKQGFFPSDPEMSSETRALQPLAPGPDGPVRVDVPENLATLKELFTLVEKNTLTERQLKDLIAHQQGDDPAVKSMATALLYKHDEKIQWPAMVQHFGVRDYKDRSEGNKNYLDGDAFTKTMNTLGREYYGIDPVAGPMLVGFLKYRDTNSWLTFEKKDVSVARFLRSAFLATVLSSKEKAIEAAGRIDAAVQAE